MVFESLLVAILFCLSVVPILVVVWRIRLATRWVLAAVVVFWLVFPLALVSTAIHYQDGASDRQPVTYRPIEVASDGYVGSKTCRSCHPYNHATWRASYHRTMTQVATPESVLGDFGNVVLPLGAERILLSRRGDEFWMTRQLRLGAGASSQPLTAERPVVLTTGSHHLQAYWLPIQEDTRFLTMLPFVYLKEAQRWVPTKASFIVPPHSSTDDAGRWNRACIVCHTTYGRMGVSKIDYDFRDFDTQVAEFGISCEACHGPGQQHSMVNRDPARRYQHHLGSRPDPTIVNPANLTHHLSSQVCGQCHGVFEFFSREAFDQWAQSGFTFRPGDELADSKFRFLVRPGSNMPQVMRERLEQNPDRLAESFWSDGMIRIAGREYNGLVESPCFQRGEMSCLSCHRMHQSASDPRRPNEWANDQLQLGMDGNEACLQCHQEFRGEDELVLHTHHSARSAGSVCYNCHMPHTTYGLLKAIRTHQIDVPSVAASVTTGRPNACNQCHLDKTLAWTADHLATWYAIDEEVRLSREEQMIAASVLWLLRGDACQRALMAWSYGWHSAHEASGSDWLAPFLAQLLEDPYDAVRYIAGRSLRRLPDYANFHYDFIAPPQQRAASHEQALAIWQRLFATSTERVNDRVLIDRQGDLMQEEYDRLLSNRDDRPVSLAE